jgi:hypothetical protein
VPCAQQQCPKCGASMVRLRSLFNENCDCERQGGTARPRWR